MDIKERTKPISINNLKGALDANINPLIPVLTKDLKVLYFSKFSFLNS